MKYINGIKTNNEFSIEVLMRECPSCKRPYVLWPLPKDLRNVGVTSAQVRCLCGLMIGHSKEDWYED